MTDASLDRLDARPPDLGVPEALRFPLDFGSAVALTGEIGRSSSEESAWSGSIAIGGIFAEPAVAGGSTGTVIVMSGLAAGSSTGEDDLGGGECRRETSRLPFLLFGLS
jgi:hypothetical protein